MAKVRTISYCYTFRKRKRCTHPAKYWVYKPDKVNRLLCGYHAKKFIRANTSVEVANRLTGGKEKLPYQIETEWRRGKDIRR